MEYGVEWLNLKTSAIIKCMAVLLYVVYICITLCPCESSCQYATVILGIRDDPTRARRAV